MSALWLILPALTHRVPCIGVCVFSISSEFEGMWRGCGRRQDNMWAYSFLLLQSPMILDQLLNSSEPHLSLSTK